MKSVNVFIVIFLAAVSLLKLPSFYIFSDSAFTSTHTLAKLAIMGIFFLEILQKKYNKQFKHSTVFLLLFLVFLTHSLSVINAVDIFAFLKQYQNLLLDIMIFILAFFFIQTAFLRKHIIKYMLFFGVIVISFEIFFLFFPEIFISLFTTFIPIQNELMDLYKINLGRLSRVNLFLHSELFYPFFLYGLFNNKKNIMFRIFCTVAVVGLFVVSVSSKFRTRLIQTVFASVSYLISLKRNFYKFVVFIAFIIMIVSSFIFLTEINNRTIFDRILDPEKQEDVETVNFRREQMDEAFYQFKAYPVFGVGLGNYKTYIDKSRLIGVRNTRDREHYTATSDNPHSIFIQVLSETGLLGFIAYTVLLLYFIFTDFKIYKNKNDSSWIMLFIIGSWTVFLYGIMNPFNTVFLNGWFWFLRGIVHGSLYSNINETKK